MRKDGKKSPQRIAIIDLYPDLTAQQQEEAEYFLRRYLDLIRRICRRRRDEKNQKNEPSSVSSKNSGNLTE